MWQYVFTHLNDTILLKSHLVILLKKELIFSSKPSFERKQKVMEP